MLQYLVIQLDDTSTSYCVYKNGKASRNLMNLDTLKAGILFAMKENLMVQFVYPDYVLPEAHKEVIHTIDHSCIVPYRCKDMDLVRNADVVVFQDLKEVGAFRFQAHQVCTVRTDKADFFCNYALLKDLLASVTRVNIVITDIENFTASDFKRYEAILNELVQTLEVLYANGRFPQLNLLTDRIMLAKMNNCNAGWESVVLAPDAKFYVCPAFYLESDGYPVGDIQAGLDVKNPQLYRIDHAPICRNCDAYQCRRCVWLNRKTTQEVNTPGHEQCVLSHLERNASRRLLASLRTRGDFFVGIEIPEIDYLDPFEKIND